MDRGAWWATVSGGRKELDTIEHAFTYTGTCRRINCCAILLVSCCLPRCDKRRGGNGPGSWTSSWPSLTPAQAACFSFLAHGFNLHPLFEGRSHTHTPKLSLFLASTHAHTPTHLYSWPAHAHAHTHTHTHTPLAFFIPGQHTHTHTHTHTPSFLYAWPAHTHTHAHARTHTYLPLFLANTHTHTPAFLYSWPSVLFPLLKLAINLTLRQPDSLMIPWYSDNCKAEQHQSGL